MKVGLVNGHNLVQLRPLGILVDASVHHPFAGSPSGGAGESATADDVRAAMPHPVVGSAADPIAPEPVDDVVITTLVDNVYDALLTGGDTITREPLAAGTAQAPPKGHRHHPPPGLGRTR